MTRENFIKQIMTPANMYTFDTTEHSGMVAMSGRSHFVIRVGDTIGEYKSADELIDRFEVDGKKFSESVMPQIQTLNVMRA